MLQVRNSTPFPATLALVPDRTGVDTLYAIVKGTLAIGPSVAVAEEQVPISPKDEHHGDPSSSSVRRPSDMSLDKPGTDVVLTGSAWAPNERPTWQLDVSVSVGPLAKRVRVFGDRAWDAGPAGATVAWVAPFVRMPLVWERAFGGTDATPQGAVAEPRNPVGIGFRTAASARPLAGMPLPNIEDPSALISSWKDRPPPAALAPVAAHWLPRRSYAGTYDERWQKTRAPYLPDDFDPRFCQIAPPGLSSVGHLRGDEVVDLQGVTPAGAVRVALPAVQLQATYRVGNSAETRHARLDTVLIEPDERRLIMVWRAALPCDKKVLKIRGVDVRFVNGGRIA